MNSAVVCEERAPLDWSTFEAALRSQQRGYWDKHPFHIRMAAGELDADDLRAWVANRWYYQKTLPQKDAAIIANCPSPAVRRAWIQRILFHDGPDDHHGGLAQWLVLADAVGLSRDEVLDERHVVTGVRDAVDSYLSFARTRPWHEGVASSLTELFAPQTMAARITAWRQHYPWIRATGLGYFEYRVDRAQHEGLTALEIVLSHCTTRDRQDAAIDALRFKTRVLWSMADAIERAMDCR